MSGREAETELALLPEVTGRAGRGYVFGGIVSSNPLRIESRSLGQGFEVNLEN